MTEALAPTSRSEFFDSYASDPAAAGFAAFLFGHPVEVPDEPDLSNAHMASLVTFSAIQTKNEALFRRVYSELSRRQLRVEAPWWLNDPLMYGLVLGAVRFGGDTSWIHTTLRFRVEHSTGESHDVASTFIDILTENWGSEVNLRPIVLVAWHLLGMSVAEAGLLNASYRAITETPFPYHESNFLNAVYLRAFDVVVLSKAPEDPDRVRALERLVDTAWKRARTRGWIVWWVGLLLILAAFASLLLWVRDLAEGTAMQWIETLSLVGIPLVAVLPIWPWITKRERIVEAVQRWEVTRYFGLDPKVLPRDQKQHNSLPTSHNPPLHQTKG